MSSWSVLPYGQWDELAAFLRKEEWRHLHFSSRIKSALEKKQILPLRDQILICRSADGGLSEALCITPQGLIFPAINNEAQNDSDRDLAEHLKNRVLFSIVGTAPRVNRINGAVRRPARAINNYLMMTGPEKSESGKTLPEGIRIRQAVPEDLDRLLPLETAYQIEEVLLSPSEADTAFIRRNLAAQIREQWIYLAESGTAVVAKGGTNAAGFGYMQLGGVFTRPDYRNRGIACALVKTLLIRIEEAGLQSALFVKPENPSALALYKKLDFSVREDFRILYYR